MKLRPKSDITFRSIFDLKSFKYKSQENKQSLSNQFFICKAIVEHLQDSLCVFSIDLHF